jgi:hypothetical protein
MSSGHVPLAELDLAHLLQFLKLPTNKCVVVRVLIGRDKCSSPINFGAHHIQISLQEKIILVRFVKNGFASKNAYNLQ